jgi:hypothetical protein
MPAIEHLQLEHLQPGTPAADAPRWLRKESKAGLLGSLNMLVMTDGGFDYSASECFAWMKETGFERVWAEPLTADQSMVVGIK